MSLVADELVPDGALVLASLHKARRRNRLANLDWFDAFYKAYLSGGGAALGIYAASGAIGDAAVRGGALARVTHEGAAWLGILVALVVAVGLRSGGRGGPLAFERAEVRHVLLAPVDRRDSIRRPALRRLQHALFVGAATGAAGGILAVKRLPHLPVAWIACGALFGAALGALGFGTALIAGGVRLPRWAADLCAMAVVGWSGIDVWQKTETSPASMLAGVALWPLRSDRWAFLGLAVALAVAVVGVLAVPGISMEAAERRSRLVGQLRFAATLQDVRTVMVLQRQLAQEHVRQRPWVRLPAARRDGLRKDGKVALHVYLRRSLNGLLRWPATRGLRLVLLAALAGVSVCGAWLGTTPLLVVAGLAMYVAALDLLEPLSQEADHPDRLRSVGRLRGTVTVHHLIVAYVVLLALVVAAGIPAYVWGTPEVVVTLLPLAPTAALLALGGAAVTVDRPPHVPSGSVETPEIAGAKFAWRVLMPPGLAVLGLVPLVPARHAWVHEHTAAAMNQHISLAFSAILACGTWAVMWVRYGEQIRETMTTMGANAISGEKSER